MRVDETVLRKEEEEVRRREGEEAVLEAEEAEAVVAVEWEPFEWEERDGLALGVDGEVTCGLLDSPPPSPVPPSAALSSAWEDERATLLDSEDVGMVATAETIVAGSTALLKLSLSPLPAPSSLLPSP